MTIKNLYHHLHHFITMPCQFVLESFVSILLWIFYMVLNIFQNAILKFLSLIIFIFYIFQSPWWWQDEDIHCGGSCSCGATPHFYDFVHFFGGNAVWEGGYHRKMVICANLMWILERTVFIISKCSRKLEHCIENDFFFFLSLDDHVHF